MKRGLTSSLVICLALLTIMISFVSAKICTDSDNGIDYYTPGKIINPNDPNLEPVYDNCKNGTLFEVYCGEKGIVSVDQGYNCPNGCKDHGCMVGGSIPDFWIYSFTGVKEEYSPGDKINFEVAGFQGNDKMASHEEGFAINVLVTNMDEDYIYENKIYTNDPGVYKEGHWYPEVTSPSTGGKSYKLKVVLFCARDEANCSQLYGQHTDRFVTRIFNGVDKEIVEITPNETTGPIELPEAGNETTPEAGNETTPEAGNETTPEKNYVCNGCVLDKKCYPFGYRIEGEYCTDEGNFSNQKESDASCNNSFECSTNLCIDNECVSSGFWQAIMRFFKNLFG